MTYNSNLYNFGYFLRFFFYAIKKKKKNLSLRDKDDLQLIKTKEKNLLNTIIPSIGTPIRISIIPTWFEKE